MSGNSFHSGELEVQKRAGVRREASSLAGVMRTSIPPAAAQFLQQQQMIVAATRGTDGSVWSSLLFGEPGFASSLDNRTVKLRVRPRPEDPLWENIMPGAPFGLLAFEAATRRRAKFKGSVRTLEADAITLQIERCYALCPKYIQAREIVDATQALSTRALQGSSLKAKQQQMIEHADTFFIASYHLETGADASHRGGAPGFVRVIDSETLLFPDYSGNNMFNTLGNIAVNPNTGLLFPDFNSKAILQLSGTASILWNDSRTPQFAGAQRLLEFKVRKAIWRENALPFDWRFLDYSPFNP